MAAALEWWMSARRQLHKMSAAQNVGEPTIALLARSSFQMQEKFLVSRETDFIRTRVPFECGTRSNGHCSSNGAVLGVIHSGDTDHRKQRLHVDFFFEM